MRITDIQAIPLSIPLKEIRSVSASGRLQSGYQVLVKVSTDEGITGYGEAWRLTPGAVSTFIEEALKPHLVGEDPRHVERLWYKMYFTTFRYGRKGLPLNAISGVEIALWDIIGKYRSIPVYEMIGGLCQSKLKAYASLPNYQRIEDVVNMALWCVEQGYSAIKLHQTDTESVQAVRQAVGPDIMLMLDVNGAWEPREAVMKASKLEHYDVFWLEEPVSPMDDYDGLAYVKNNSRIFIAAGENEYTHYGYREMIARHAVDIVQPDPTKSGGILPCRKIIALAEAWNLQTVLHCYCHGPGVAAALHLSLSNMSSEYVEINAVPLKESFIQPDLRPENGYLTLTDSPGLGVEIDEDVVKRYPYTGS